MHKYPQTGSVPILLYALVEFMHYEKFNCSRYNLECSWGDMYLADSLLHKPLS